VVANVVGNALQHRPAETTVRVEAAAHKGRAVIRIVDRGPGVPVDERGRVFDAFQRLGDSGAEGVGLGLAVARGFMVAMDGDLTIDDTPGGGLTVTLSLPLAGATSAVPPPATTAVGP
jgi:two-component system, OmpR family, sensor histidine kinase KdpD